MSGFGLLVELAGGGSVTTKPTPYSCIPPTVLIHKKFHELDNMTSEKRNNIL